MRRKDRKKKKRRVLFFFSAAIGKLEKSSDVNNDVVKLEKKAPKLSSELIKNEKQTKALKIKTFAIINFPAG